MEESTFLSRAFADQGLKIRIRKELRQRRKISRRKGSEDISASHEEEKVGKRSRLADQVAIDRSSEPSKGSPDYAAASEAPILHGSYSYADRSYQSISSPDNVVDQSRPSTLSSRSNFRDLNQLRPYHLSAQRISSYNLPTNLHTHYPQSSSAGDTYPTLRPASEPTMPIDMDPGDRPRIQARSWAAPPIRSEPVTWQPSTPTGMLTNKSPG